jgi:hypothetical protein
MNIYIDESGVFANPMNKQTSVSCIAALIIPEIYENEISQWFKIWKNGYNEIKGRELNEKKISQVINFLCHYDVIVKVVVIDIALNTDAQISRHKYDSANGMIKHLTPKHHYNMVRKLNELKIRIEKLPNQLYVQSCLLEELVDKIIRSSTLYYAQRIPKTLGRFNWVIDAKEKVKTEYEKLWTTIVAAILEAKSLNDPMLQIEEADYSDFARFYSNSKNGDHLKPYIKDQTKLLYGCNIKKIVTENLSFDCSTDNIGLQLIDIIANAIRRALNNNLQWKGWCNIGKLMVQNILNKDPMDMLILGAPIINSNLSYSHVFKVFNNKCKPMIRKS